MRCGSAWRRRPAARRAATSGTAARRAAARRRAAGRRRGSCRTRWRRWSTAAMRSRCRWSAADEPIALQPADAPRPRCRRCARRPTTRPTSSGRWRIGSFSALVRDLPPAVCEAGGRRPAARRRRLRWSSRAPAPSRSRSAPSSTAGAGHARPVRRRALAPLSARLAAGQLPARPARVAGRRGLRAGRFARAGSSSCCAAANARAGATAAAMCSTGCRCWSAPPLPPLGASLAAIGAPLPEMEFWFGSEGVGGRAHRRPVPRAPAGRPRAAGAAAARAATAC